MAECFSSRGLASSLPFGVGESFSFPPTQISLSFSSCSKLTAAQNKQVCFYTITQFDDPSKLEPHTNANRKFQYCCSDGNPPRALRGWPSMRPIWPEMDIYHHLAVWLHTHSNGRTCEQLARTHRSEVLCWDSRWHFCAMPSVVHGILR